MYGRRHKLLITKSLYVILKHIGVEFAFKIKEIIRFLLCQAIYLSSTYKNARLVQGFYPLKHTRALPWTHPLRRLQPLERPTCILHFKTQSLFKNGHLWNCLDKCLNPYSICLDIGYWLGSFSYKCCAFIRSTLK